MNLVRKCAIALFVLALLLVMPTPLRDERLRHPDVVLYSESGPYRHGVVLVSLNSARAKSQVFHLGFFDPTEEKPGTIKPKKPTPYLLASTK